MSRRPERGLCDNDAAGGEAQPCFVAALSLDRLNKYDFHQTYKLDHHGDAVELLPGDFDAVVLAWPNLGTSFAVDVARAMRPGQTLVYEGEWVYSACADDAFLKYIKLAFDTLDAESDALNEHLLRFTTLHDHWTVLSKK